MSNIICKETTHGYWISCSMFRILSLDVVHHVIHSDLMTWYSVITLVITLSELFGADLALRPYLNHIVNWIYMTKNQGKFNFNSQCSLLYRSKQKFARKFISKCLPFCSGFIEPKSLLCYYQYHRLWFIPSNDSNPSWQYGECFYGAKRVSERNGRRYW